MQGALEDFFRALRSADVRVSPAEAIDAHRTVATVGFADRELFKDALCATLAKSAEEVDRFDRIFDTFFAREAFRRHSYVSDVAVGVVTGFGPESYRLGLEALLGHLASRRGA